MLVLNPTIKIFFECIFHSISFLVPVLDTKLTETPANNKNFLIEFVIEMYLVENVCLVVIFMYHYVLITEQLFIPFLRIFSLLTKINDQIFDHKSFSFFLFLANFSLQSVNHKMICKVFFIYHNTINTTPCYILSMVFLMPLIKFDTHHYSGTVIKTFPK